MRGLSLATRASSPALNNLSTSQKSFNPPKLTTQKNPSNSKTDRFQRQTNHTEASLTGNNSLSLLNSQLTKPNSVSVPRGHISHNRDTRSVDRHYISRILRRNDWFLLLNHELKAKRINLNPQFVVSVLQNQENPIYPLRFYIWVSNVDPLYIRNQAVKGVLANAFYRKGPVVLSVDLLKDIRNSGFRVDEDLLCILIGSWGRLGLAKYCEEIFGQISFLGINPSTRLYNAVIDALVKSNSLDLAYLKFQQMSADNCKPDRFTYNMLIHGVCKIGVVDEALRLVKQMEGFGYSANVYTYTILIYGPNEATIRSLVHGVFHCVAPCEAFELVINFIEKEPVLGRLACDTLLCCLSEKCMPKEAGALLRKLGERGYLPGNSTFNITMTCLLKGLDVNETCGILDKFIERGVKLGFSFYLALIETLYKAGRGMEGDRYLNQMVKDKLVSDVFSYNMVIDCFCNANVMNKAVMAFKVMQDRGISPNLVTFNTLISGHSKNGEVHKARELLQMLLELGLKPDIFTFSSIIDGLCRAQLFDDALSCFGEMVEWGVSPNAVTYNILIRSLCLIGGVGRSMKLLKNMRKDGISPDIFSLNALIQSFCRMGKVEKAEKIFVSMSTLGLIPDNYTYGALIKALFESGRCDEAKKMFFAMEVNGCVPDSFTCKLISENLVKQGDFEEVQKITEICSEREISLKSIPAV
ncbi:pentatricopeptide repeat-containing protein [Salix suchowensis]|nr:pentatricopeptide repeat-containing protein [Salix suchowensis]